jgi:hypothetical protein
MHETAMADKCEKSIFACEDKVSMVESISTCTAKGNPTAMYFGLMPLTFVGKTGYADFLSSIADNPFVFRQLQNGSAAGGKGIIFPCDGSTYANDGSINAGSFHASHDRILQ